MRLFIAVPVPDGVRSAAGDIIRSLRESGADFKWVEPENLHLTVAFLGEAAEDRVPFLKEAMAEAVRDRASFDFSFGDLGAFDSLDHPRVLWLGVAEGAKALEDLGAALGAALDRRGLLPEKDKGRTFHAHLTLGRMRGPRNLGRLRDILKAMTPQERVACRVERLVLFESRLSSRGPTYRELGAAPLTG